MCSVVTVEIRRQYVNTYNHAACKLYYHNEHGYFQIEAGTLYIEYVHSSL